MSQLAAEQLNQCNSKTVSWVKVAICKTTAILPEYMLCKAVSSTENLNNTDLVWKNTVHDLDFVRADQSLKIATQASS